MQINIRLIPRLVDRNLQTNANTKRNRASVLGVLNLLTLTGSNCIMINKGVKQWETILIALIGIVILFLALRFFMKHLEYTANNPMPSWLRFLVGFTLGVLVLVA